MNKDKSNNCLHTPSAVKKKKKFNGEKLFVSFSQMAKQQMILFFAQNIFVGRE